MTLKETWRLVKESVSAWIDDYASSMGAALSYYTVFSIAPLLLIVIVVAGMVFGREAAQGQIVTQLQGLIGEEGAMAVQGLLKSVAEPAKGIIAAVVSVITLVIGATSVFAELQSDMDRIWRAPPPTGSGIWHLLRTRLLSFGIVLGLAFVLLVSLVVSAVLAALGAWWGSAFGDQEALLQLLNFVVSFAFITGMFAMIYKFLPRVRIAWRDVWIGAAVTALLFGIGKLLIGLYLGKSGVTSGFGAAGSLVVLLIWVYYSAQIFLLGAEFTWVYAHRHGSKIDAAADAPQHDQPAADQPMQQGDRLLRPVPNRSHGVAPATSAAAATVQGASNTGARSSGRPAIQPRTESRNRPVQGPARVADRQRAISQRPHSGRLSGQPQAPGLVQMHPVRTLGLLALTVVLGSMLRKSKPSAHAFPAQLGASKHLLWRR